MKSIEFTILILSLLAFTHLSSAQMPPPPPNGGQPPYQQQDNENKCDPDVCVRCDTNTDRCVQCKRDYYVTRKGDCEDREELEDRGDGFSLAFGIINMIFLFAIYHGWVFVSRRNQNSYINLNYNNELNQQALQKLSNNNQSPQLIQVGAPSDKTSEFDIRSKKSSTVQPQDDEKNNIFGNYKKNSPTQLPAFDIEQNASPDYTKGQIQNYPNNNQQNFQNPQQLQESQQENNKKTTQQFVTDNLNGYWMTQAGKFSFQNFNNFHRIKHVVINFIILQRIFSSYFRMAERRGDDSDDDDRKNLLFIAFLVGMVIYWLLTFIPPIVIKIFSYCFCLKSDPNGRCSNIFILILFYVAAITMTVATSGVVFRMTGFEAQVFLLVCLAGYLLVIFFDKKSVEFAKKHKGGKMEGLIKFRKIDFSSNQEQQQQPVL